MTRRRRYRRRYRRPAAAAKQGDDGCVTAVITLVITWGLCLLAVGIAIALH